MDVFHTGTSLVAHSRDIAASADALYPNVLEGFLACTIKIGTIQWWVAFATKQHADLSVSVNVLCLPHPELYCAFVWVLLEIYNGSRQRAIDSRLVAHSRLKFHIFSYL